MGWMNISHAQEARIRAARAKLRYQAALINKYKPNGKTEEIIGLVDPTLTHITTDAVPGTLTQTTFDTTSRADSAQILLTNSTGASRVIIAAWIRGKPVTRLSGTEGYLHDKFVDYEAQARDGDITFELGNNMVVTADQVNKLADYEWKLNKVKKHIYVLSLVGFQSWFEPSEWYTLDIGVEGTAENILSTVECFDVRCSILAGGAGYTSISFREVEELWKFDSNEVTRMIASGGFNRRPSQNVVVVAAQYYSGYADYYCDGTADQNEINDAITYLGQSGGGKIHLSKGIYNITSAITMLENITLEGEGMGTSIVKNCNDYAIGATGTIATALTGISIYDLGLTCAYWDTNVIALLNFNYVNDFTIDSMVVSGGYGNGVEIYNCENGKIEAGVKIANCADTGLKIVNSTTINTGSVTITECHNGYESYPAIDTNMISHGDCESADEPMLDNETVPHISGATWAKDSDRAYDGTYSYKYIKTASSGTASYVGFHDNAATAFTDLHGLTPGNSYRFECMAYIPSGGIVSTEIFIRQGYFINTSNSWSDTRPLAIYNDWQMVSSILTLPSSATGAYLYAETETTAAASEYFNIDEVKVYEFIDQNSGCQLVNCAISKCSSIGVFISMSDVVIQNNQINGNGERGLFISSGYRNIVSGNRCFNNGDDAGFDNTNSDNFYDGGTDTQWAG